jgi:hypothetical protein
MKATLSQKGSTGQPSGQAAGRVSSPPPTARAAGGAAAVLALLEAPDAAVVGASARCRPSHLQDAVLDIL